MTCNLCGFHVAHDHIGQALMMEHLYDKHPEEARKAFGRRHV